MEHTKGPWEVRDYVATCCKGQMALSCKEIWAGNRRICSTVNEDNAPLIAAAPDSIDVVREFIEVCTYLRDAGNDDDSTLIEAIDAGNAYLTKATGD